MPPCYVIAPDTIPCRGVITHIYDPKIITTCITAFNKVPDTRVIDTSCPKILVRLAHFFRVFRRFLVTTGQSLSEAVRIQPRYLNYGTDLSGRPYSWKSYSVLSRILGREVILPVPRYLSDEPTSSVPSAGFLSPQANHCPRP